MPLKSILGTPEIASDTTAMQQSEFVNLLQNLGNMSADEVLSIALTLLGGALYKLLMAVLLYLIGAWIIRRLVRILRSIFEARSVEVSLSKFILSLVNIALSIMLIFSVVGVLGISTTSFLALFASAGLAVGMALSGTLQNFAGGVLILFLKPFKVGDLIEAQGFTGTVKEISLFSTLLNTIDNKMVIIPNGDLSTGIINNYSKETTRRIQWTFGVAYGTDFKRAKAVVAEVLSEHDLILHDEEIFITIGELNNSSVDILVRVWCRSADYWTIFFSVNEAIYAKFNEEGIEIPFPQMDVHLKQK
ncbi:MAG: mechanosensitive ion channel domain-containing protein [Rikenellaceae bacterium]